MERFHGWRFDFAHHNMAELIRLRQGCDAKVGLKNYPKLPKTTQNYPKVPKVKCEKSFEFLVSS